MSIHIPTWLAWTLFGLWPVVWYLVGCTGSERLDAFGWPSIAPTRWYVATAMLLLWVLVGLLVLAYWLGCGFA